MESMDETRNEQNEDDMMMADTMLINKPKGFTNTIMNWSIFTFNSYFSLQPNNDVQWCDSL